MTYSQYWDEDCISIHAPHTGRDLSSIIGSRAKVTFQSTRPIRGATFAPRLKSRFNGISIHAPHTGRDLTEPRERAGMATNFNPRAPYGARRV